MWNNECVYYFNIVSTDLLLGSFIYNNNTASEKTVFKSKI